MDVSASTASAQVLSERMTGPIFSRSVILAKNI
jgi:hypothetical protein